MFLGGIKAIVKEFSKQSDTLTKVFNNDGYRSLHRTEDD